LGSEEEIAFLAAVAVKETDGVDVNNLDYSMRSHMLLGVMLAVFEAERKKHVEDLKQRIVEASRIDEGKAEQWIRKVLMMIDSNVQKRGEWPSNAVDQDELLRRIMLEMGSFSQDGSFRWFPRNSISSQNQGTSMQLFRLLTGTDKETHDSLRLRNFRMT
jgi:hypothetical protein